MISIRPRAAAPLVLAALYVSSTGGSVSAESSQSEQAQSYRVEPYFAYGCSQCHGTAGEGGWAGPALSRQVTLKFLLAKLRGRGNRMPTYSERILPEMDAELIVRYLANLPEDPAPADLPQLVP